MKGFLYKMVIFDQYLMKQTFLIEIFYHFIFLTVDYLDIKVKVDVRVLKIIFIHFLY